MSRELKVSDGVLGDTLQLLEGHRGVQFSCAHSAALDPCADAFVRVVDSTHAFAAVLTASSQCPAFGYLRMKLHKQLLAELQLLNGNTAIFDTAVKALDKSWQRMHPYHTSILEGFRGISMALVDASRQLVYLASYGSSRVACSYRRHDSTLPHMTGVSQRATNRKTLFEVEVIPLAEVSCIVTASSGLWDEVPPSKALLRLRAFQQLDDSSLAASAAPQTISRTSSSDESAADSSRSESSESPGQSPTQLSSAAAHLVNYAMHGILQRMRQKTDPRMRALSSVTALQSLWVGSRANYEGHGRTPMRRRRGDVYNDLTAVVIELSEPGTRGPESCTAQELLSPPQPHAMQHADHPYREPQPRSATVRWRLLRMHFLEFPQADRQQTLEKWHSVISAARQQASARMHRAGMVIQAVHSSKVATADAAALIWPERLIGSPQKAHAESKASHPASTRAAWPVHATVAAVAASA